MLYREPSSALAPFFFSSVRHVLLGWAVPFACGGSTGGVCPITTIPVVCLVMREAGERKGWRYEFTSLR